MRYVDKKEEGEGEEEVYIITTPLEKIEESIGHLHIVKDDLPLPPDLTGDEYNTIDRLFRNYIVISDYAMTEDGGIDHNDDKTLFDALAIRLYNGGFFLAYKYDRDDPDNQYGYWEYREYWDKKW